MRLSEAIRLGAMLKPQAFDSWGSDHDSCAIGAAHDAIGIKRTAARSTTPWFDLYNTTVLCPAGCNRRQRVLINAVTHLNDEHRWTREQIADWVEGIERAQSQTDGVRELQEQELSKDAASTSVSA